MSPEQQRNISDFIVTITTLIFAVTSLITVYISGSAWRDEREGIRPYLTLHASPEVTLTDRQLIFHFQFQNVGVHPVENLNTQTMIVGSELKSAPLHIDQYSQVNYIPQNSPAALLIKVNNPPYTGQYYLIIDLKYSDPVLAKDYEQIVYLRWPGIVEGEITPIFHASQDDKNKILDYLKKQ
jgi:hypothetical protein